MFDSTQIDKHAQQGIPCRLLALHANCLLVMLVVNAGVIACNFTMMKLATTLFHQVRSSRFYAVYLTDVGRALKVLPLPITLNRVSSMF